jgi:hypothetical protein
VRGGTVIRVYGDLNLPSGAGRITGVIRNQINMNLLKNSRMPRPESATHNIAPLSTDHSISQTIRAEPRTVRG